ncbi:hypothetical protein D3C87_2026310 [compost metagenome]
MDDLTDDQKAELPRHFHEVCFLLSFQPGDDFMDRIEGNLLIIGLVKLLVHETAVLGVLFTIHKQEPVPEAFPEFE